MKKTSYKVAAVSLVIAGLISLKVYAAIPKKPAPQVWTPGCVAIRTEVLANLQGRFHPVRSRI